MKIRDPRRHSTVRVGKVPLEHDPEKWKPVFPRDKREAFAQEDHAQTKRRDHDPIRPIGL
ncbi:MULTISPECIES: hypothetical protein [unclassified Bradyrhizobium]